MSRFRRAGRGPATRVLRTLTAVVLLAAPLMVFRALPAAAAFTNSFVMDGAPDFNPASATDAVQSATDSSYAGEGSQERDICPTTGFDTIPDNKADLYKLWVDNDGDHLYLAWSRININGTAAVTFELNQSSVACGNGVNNVRTAGDLLISYNFQGNGLSNIEIGYRTWIGGATTGEWSGPQDTILDTNKATGRISADLTFGELEIDLTAAGIFNANQCVNFASVFAKSRASAEGFNSKLKDVTPPVSTSVTNCAYITVVKDATPNGSTSFPFTFAKSGAATSTPFSLVDDGDATTPGHSWKTPTGLLDVNANYVITETPPDPTPGKWALTSATCTGAESYSFNQAAGQITVKPGGPVEVVCTFNNAFDPPPTVAVTKTANVTTMNEPGGPVTFTVSVWNTSNEGVTVTSLTDTVGAAVTDLLAASSSSSCDDVGRVLTASNGSRGGTDTMSCTFTITFNGNAGAVHNDRVDAVVTDDELDTGTDHDTESVALLNVLPTLDVTKTANVSTVNEPGGPVTYTVSVWNTSNEGVTVTSLTDTVGTAVANLLASSATSDCDTADRILDASNGSRGGDDTMTCTFTINVVGNAGAIHDNRVDAIVTDNDNTTATDFDTERVTVTNVVPTVDVTKTANVTTVNEPGGPVVYTVSVWNTSNEGVTVTTLTDTVGAAVANLLASSATSDCDTADRILDASNGSRGGDDTMTCTFTVNVMGNAGLVHNNRVDGIVTDDDRTTATDFDTQTVTILNVLPTLDVTKTANVSTVNEPGGPVVYTVSVWNTSNEGVTVTTLTDTVGAAVANLLAASSSSDCDTADRVLDASNGSRGGDDTMTCTFTINVVGNAGAIHDNRVDAVVTDNDNTTATDFDTERVTVTNVLPTVDVTKTANVSTVNEPGGPVVYTVSVWNTSNEGVTVTTLTDTVGASVASLLASSSSSDCDTADRVLDASNGSRGGDDTMTCTFTINVVGNADAIHDNRVDAVVTDDDNTTATDFDTEMVTVTNVLPTVDVTKTANVTTLNEPGGPVVYTVSVWNTSNEGVTVTTLTDTVGASVANLLAGSTTSDCDTANRTLAPSNGSRGGDDTMTCTFTIAVVGNAGATHNNRVDAVVTDDDQTTATDFDTETVTLLNVLPTLDVTKTADLSSINEPGGPVIYTVSVWNTSNEGVTVTSLTDAVGAAVANLLTSSTTSDCDTANRTLAASNGSRGGDDTMTCTFTINVVGNAGATHNNRVTGVVTDDDNTTATDFDDESVAILNVLPTVNVTKTANVTTVNEPGGPVIYTVSVWNTSNEGVTVTSLTDKVGAVVADLLASSTSSDCDTANRTLAASNGSRGGDDTMTCTFTINVVGNAGFVHDNRVDAVVTDDDQTTATHFDTETVTVLNVLPTLDVTKTANVTSVNEPGGPVVYTVSVWNTSNEGVTVTSLTDTVGAAVANLLSSSSSSDCDTANRTLAASNGSRGGDDTMTCTFTLNVLGNAGFVHNNRVDAVVTDDDNTTATDQDAETVTVLNVLPTLVVTKTANPTAVSELGGPVVFTVTVQNTSIEAVTLTKLVDSVFGDLNGRGTCATGGVIGIGATYSCTFTATLVGQPATPHRNVAEATVRDDEGSTATDDDDAEVTFIDVLPSINVEKSPSAPVIRTGTSVTYTYVVTNTGGEPLADVQIVDNKCATITFSGGDTDGDKLLDTTETWSYSCTQALSVDTTNVVTVSGRDDDGSTTSDTDDAVVKVISPVIAIDKVAGVTSASPGQTVRYTYTVTNPGNDPLSDITLTDDKCSPLTRTGGDADNDGKLDPGEAWVYICDDLVDAAGQLTNVAVVTGTPTVGPNVSARDTVSIPVVLGEVIERPAPAVAAAPTLPRTGAQVLRLVSAAMLFLVGGMSLVVLFRRRDEIG